MDPALTGPVVVGQSVSQVTSVSELLQKYTQALDATQSFIASYEEVCNYRNRMPSNSEVVGGKRLARGQFRSDGHRIYLRNYYWGDFTSNTKDLPEDAPRYSLRIEADGKLYSHTTAVNTPRVKGTVAFQPSKYEKGVMNRGSCSGIYGFLGSDERLDAVLRGAKRASVRPTTETVNGIACHVIDAYTEYGRYTVWLDPTHGFHAAKITREAVGGQKEQDDVIPRGDRSTGSVIITRFKQVEGVWVPVEAEDEISYTSGAFFRSQRDQFKRNIITLNPDHDKLGSFDNPLEHPTNDPELRNGTRVRITGPGSMKVKGSWQNGKIIDESGQVVDISQLWTSVKDSLINTSLPALTDLSKDLSQVQSVDKPILVCLCDIQQRSSRNCLSRLSSKARGLSAKGLTIVVVQVSHVSGRHHAWLKNQSIDLPIHIYEGELNQARPLGPSSTCPG